MKIINIFVISLFFNLTISTNLFAQTDGKNLFIEKCSSCHFLEFPDSRSKLKASPVPGMMYQLNKNIYSDEKIIAFIKDFAMNPSEDKIIFNRLRKFGMMKSLKGAVTKKELELIAQWMVEDVFITRKNYKAAKLRMKHSDTKVE